MTNADVDNDHIWLVAQTGTGITATSSYNSGKPNKFLYKVELSSQLLIGIINFFQWMMKKWVNVKYNDTVLIYCSLNTQQVSLSTLTIDYDTFFLVIL